MNHLLQIDLSDLSTLHLSKKGEGSKKIILSAESAIKDWQQGKFLQIIRQGEKNSIFEKFYLTNLTSPIFSLPLPQSNFEFLDNQPYPDLSFITNKNNLLLIKSADHHPQVFTLKGKQIIPFPDKNRLLYFNEHEIQILKSTNNPSFLFPWQREILTRFSQPINRLSLTADWVYYLMNNKIMNLEIDLANFKNQHLLFEADTIKDFAQKANLIYFAGSVKKQPGLYLIKIMP